MGHIRKVIAVLVLVQATYAQYDDGLANAPAGVGPQHPTWLEGYAKRPPWNVAGVDYGVGYPAGTVLKNPATINISGVDTDGSAHRIWINTSNVTLDGYDFSGWELIIGARGTAHTTVIKNCHFEGSITAGWNNVQDLYVGYCIIDGMGIGDFLIFLNGGSGLTAEYNWIKNSHSDFISVSSGGPIIIRYNLMEQNGAPDTHPDWLQMLGSSFTTTSIMYNTVYVSDRIQGTQGFMVEGTQTAEIGRNTMVAKGAGVSYFVAAGASVSGLIHNNYVDPTTAYGFYHGNVPGNVTVCGNYNMLNGQIYSGLPTCPGSPVTDGTTPASPAGKPVFWAAPATGMIEFQFPGRAVSGIMILDVQGRLIKTVYGKTWDGSDGQGRRVPAGVYFYTIPVGPETFSGRVMVAR